MGSTVGVGGTIGGKLLPADMGRRGRMRQKCLERPLSLPGREGCKQTRATAVHRDGGVPAQGQQPEQSQSLPRCKIKCGASEAPPCMSCF